MFNSTIKQTIKFWQQCQDTIVRFDERNEMHDTISPSAKGVKQE
jgi:hypothetical protein